MQNKSDRILNIIRKIITDTNPDLQECERLLFGEFNEKYRFNEDVFIKHMAGVIQIVFEIDGNEHFSAYSIDISYRDVCWITTNNDNPTWPLKLGSEHENFSEGQKAFFIKNMDIFLCEKRL